MIGGLPVKTKIVAWGMIIIGAVCGISLILGTIFVVYATTTQSYGLLYETPIALFLFSPTAFLITPTIFSFWPDKFLQLIPYFLLTILLFFFGSSLLKRKKWAWWGALFVLTIFLIIDIWFVFTYCFVIPSILLLPLLFDRKKYFEVCS